MEGPTTGDNHTRAAEVQTGTQLTHSTSVAVPLIVTTVVAAEVLLVGVEVQAVVVRVILVLVPKVVVLVVVVAVAPRRWKPARRSAAENRKYRYLSVSLYTN